MRDRRQELTTEVTERLRRVCAHLPPELVATVAHRIVERLTGPVSTPRSEGIVVVTEHGVADLRGATVTQRVERMIAVAHPDHRAELDASADRALASA